MKTTLTILFTTLALCVRAQITLVDTTTPRTVSTTNSAYITIPGYFTNVPYTVTGTVVSKGDPTPTAFGKCNTNFLYLQTNSAGAGAQLTSVLGVLFYTNSMTGTNTTFSGTNIWGEFTNSTAFITTGNPMTNLMSFDHTNWLAYAPTNIITSAITTNSTVNYIGTNSVTNTLYFTNYFAAPLWLASSSQNATSTVTIYGVNLVPDSYLIAENAAAIAALQAQVALLTNGITTNLQYVNGTLLALTNFTAHVTNGVVGGVTSP